MSESLELDEVIRQFADSEKTLTAVRERLALLGDAEERSGLTAAALDETASAVRDFSEKAAQAVTALVQASEDARRVLEAGAKIVDGSELRDVRAGLEVLTEAVGAISDKLDALEIRVGDVDGARARANLLERQLAHIRSNVGERQLRKALESLPQA